MRATWRHEQLSARMALAAALRRSAPRSVGPGTHDALRGQMTGRAAAGPQHSTFGDGEEPAAETHPGVLAEPAVRMSVAPRWCADLFAMLCLPGKAAELADPILHPLPHCVGAQNEGLR